MTKTCESFVDGFARMAELWIARSTLCWVVWKSQKCTECRNLEAVWERFGQESRSFVQRRQFHALYAICAESHKHWLFRILLIWRVGT